MELVVHGGVGGDPADPGPRQTVLDRAAEVGVAMGTPVDAVEATINVLESSPLFNAGVGSAVQSDGVIRTDAGIMRSDLTAGAACSMPGVANAVSVARIVMERTPHVLVAGDPAVELAADFGIDTGVDLWTRRNRERWDAIDHPTGGPREHLPWVRERFGGTDTVGAVARDGRTMVAATSTGGRWFALAGRVGDVPQIGSGLYCRADGGASATGHGEAIARTNLSRQAVSNLSLGMTAQEAADHAIETFSETTGAVAGIITCSNDGSIGTASTDRMQTGYASD